MKIKDSYIAYAKNLTTYFGASMLPMALNLISNPWIAKNMSPEDYAITGFYTSFSSLISPIIGFYFLNYYIKEFFRLNDRDRLQLRALIAKSLTWLSGATSLICFIGLYVYLAAIKTDLAFPILPYLAMMVFSIPLTGLLTLDQTNARMERKPALFFKLSLINAILTVALNIIFVVLIKWGAFGKLLAPLLGNIIIFLWMLKRNRHLFKIKVPFAKYKHTILFCMPLALSAMLGYFTNGFSTTYMENIGNISEYGIYIVGFTIGGYLTTFSTAINNTFQPDIYEATIKRQWRSLAKYSLLQTLLIALVVLLFILLAPFIISILTAGRYDASTPYAQITALVALTSNIYYIINNYSIATNRPNMYLYTTIIGSIFIVLTTPWAVSNWQYRGGAWVNVFSYLAFTVINFFFLLLPKRNKNVSDENSLDH